MTMPFSTEGIARVSSRRPWTTIGLWLGVVAISIGLIGALLSGALTNEATFTNNPESKRGEDLLEERLRGPQEATEIIIIHSDEMTVDDPLFRQQVERVFSDVMALGPDVVGQALNFYQTGDASLVSAERHTTIVPVRLAGTPDDVVDQVDDLRAITTERKLPGFEILVTGQASTFKDSSEVAERDLQSAELIGIPAALVILVLVFGALVAALIPIGLAIVSIVVAVGFAALLGTAFHLSFFVTNMITMMGLAVGIDYTLFIVSRYREERRRGRPKLDAIEAAGGTASRAVVFSGMTVVLALLGMLIVPTTIFRSLAVGAIAVVIASVLVSLTLLPAILALVGDRVDSVRVPIIGRSLTRAAAEDKGGFWDWVTGVVTRRPALSILATAAVLIAAAIPFVSINTGNAGVSTLPDGLESKQGFMALQREFSGGLSSPVEIVIDGDISASPVQAAIDRLSTVLDSDQRFGPGQFEVNEQGDLAVLSVPINGDPASEEAMASVQRLRKEIIPQAFAGANAEVAVTGVTAMNLDFIKLTDRFTPVVFAFVLGLSFILLTVVFRSLVVPLKAIIMNLLSVGAAYGLMVLVFQEGVGADVLGFQQVDIIETWIPLFLFSVLFGLSMDYHVFLLSRIRERFDLTGNNSEAVRFGLRSTGRLITGAALIMVVVFSAFAAGNLVMFQQVGFGLAVAVLLDATIVRSVLVPASMQLLGNVNWYLPASLRWLPDLRVEPGEGEAPSAKGA